MATLTKPRSLVAIALAALFAPVVSGALVVACSNDNANPQPSSTVYQVEDSGSTTTPSVDSGSGPDAIAPLDDASPPNTDAQTTQLDGAAVQDAASCTTDAGCWSCTPSTAPEFLNQCTGSQCSPFANAQRLPNYDGGLPPLN